MNKICKRFWKMFFAVLRDQKAEASHQRTRDDWYPRIIESQSPRMRFVWFLSWFSRNQESRTIALDQGQLIPLKSQVRVRSWGSMVFREPKDLGWGSTDRDANGYGIFVKYPYPYPFMNGYEYGFLNLSGYGYKYGCLLNFQQIRIRIIYRYPYIYI